jgi:hypothetical protein
MHLGTKNIRNAGFRKRIWDIYTGYHCAIVGTCLRRDELRRIARKSVFALKSDASDFELHTSVVALAAENSARAKALHSLLDAKYQSAVMRFSRVKTEEAIETLWRFDVARGAIAGAFWAIMTNLVPSPNLIHRLYGEVHMLGHDFILDHQKNMRQLQELRENKSILQEILVSERQYFLGQKKELEEQIADLRMAQKEQGVLARKNSAQVQEVQVLKNTTIREGSGEELNRLKIQIDFLRQNETTLSGSIDKLSANLLQVSRMNAELKAHISRLARENEDQRRELCSLEAALVSMNTAPHCGTCEFQETGRCPGPDLCGKKILYVGGQHKMVPHYQQLVESHGGQFMHHDGGVEIARNLLPKMLGSADIVFCPVDCVSHDACTCVKKMCKHFQKPFVMMRSSGLSTLARELESIVQ